LNDPNDDQSKAGHRDEWPDQDDKSTTDCGEGDQKEGYKKSTNTNNKTDCSRNRIICGGAKALIDWTRTPSDDSSPRCKEGS
jgi:hypothetical protein